MRVETKRPMRLGVLLAAMALAVWAFSSQAQVIDTDPCQKACYDDHTACVDACGDETDPMDCESSCDQQQEDCLSQCD